MHFVVRVMLILTSCPYSEAVPIGIATQQLIPDPLESASIFHRTSPIANGSGIRTKVEANPILTRPVLLGTKSYCTLALIPDPLRVILFLYHMNNVMIAQWIWDQSWFITQRQTRIGVMCYNQKLSRDSYY